MGIQDGIAVRDTITAIELVDCTPRPESSESASVGAEKEVDEAKDEPKDVAKEDIVD